MEVKQLRYFYEIANTGSINETAKRLNMSQPPLTYQIHQLEEELQVKLFERSQKGVQLTKAGELLYERSKDILNFVDSTKEEVSKVGKKQNIRIGLTHTTQSILMPYFKTFTKNHPDIHYEIFDAITYDLLNYCMDGLVDVAIVRTPVRLDGMNYKKIKSDTMIAVSNQQTNKKTITLEELEKEPLMIYRRYESFILDAFKQKNLNPDIFCLCDDARDQLLWAKQGLCKVIFPKSMQAYCEDLTIQEIKGNELNTDILIIWPKVKKVSGLTQDFIDLFE